MIFKQIFLPLLNLSYIGLNDAQGLVARYEEHEKNIFLKVSFHDSQKIS